MYQGKSGSSLGLLKVKLGRQGKTSFTDIKSVPEGNGAFGVQKKLQNDWSS